MATAIDLLFRIRLAWMQMAADALAQGQSTRESVSNELSRFYDLLTEAVATGDPAWMEPFLQSWVNAQTSTEVVDNEYGLLPSVMPVLHVLRKVTLKTAQENLTDTESLQLIDSIEPIFSHAAEHIAREELSAGIDQVTSQLSEVHGALESLDQSKSNFISVAAHELKTPLTLIEGYSNMLQELFDRDDPKSKTLIDGITNGARRLKEIIDDMIDVSMIDNKMLSLHFQPVWLNQILEHAQAELEDVIAERSQVFEIKEFPGLHEMTYADPERLLQAIMNILRNAIKYTPDGGMITLDGRELPGFIELRVQDTGIGIAPEDQTRIFEKFGRIGNPALHSSGKTKFMGGGPGLGLPIARGILEAHGGAVWVESAGYDNELYPGSTFHLMIPMRSASPEARAARLLDTLNERKE